MAPWVEVRLFFLRECSVYMDPASVLGASSAGYAGKLSTVRGI